MKTKYYYYVGVQTDKGLQFVTSIDNKTKTAEWNAESTPLALTKSVAEDLALGLVCNCVTAIVCESLFELNGHIICIGNND